MSLLWCITSCENETLIIAITADDFINIKVATKLIESIYYLLGCYKYQLCVWCGCVIGFITFISIVLDGEGTYMLLVDSNLKARRNTKLSLSLVCLFACLSRVFSLKMMTLQTFRLWTQNVTFQILWFRNFSSIWNHTTN